MEPDSALHQNCSKTGAAVLNCLYFDSSDRSGKQEKPFSGHIICTSDANSNFVEGSKTNSASLTSLHGLKQADSGVSSYKQYNIYEIVWPKSAKI